ncbi:MAG: amino acid adenylation domain-containing protein, partial [Phormidesmis sp.]
MVDNSPKTQLNNQPLSDSPQERLRQRIASLSPAQQQLFRQRLEAQGIPWNVAVAPEKNAKLSLIPRPKRLPLSASQKHLWVLHQLYPTTTAYHIALVLRMQGSLKPQALQQSLQEIIDRHESLRTVFLQEDNRPYVEVLPQVQLILSLTDLRGEKDPAAEAIRQQNQLAQKSFNLKRGPLIRAELWQIADDTFEFGLVLHHLVADGWSRGVLLRELAFNYRSQLLVESELQLPKLTVQYPDYVLQQQRWLEGDECQRQKAYWKQQLADLPELTLLTDGVAGTRFASQICTKTFSVEQTQVIKAIAAQSGVTVFMLLLTVFKLLLHRYSGQNNGQSDIAVGVPVAGRNVSEVEPLIGFFVNTLVMRSRLNSQASFPQWLQQVQANLADALQHQEIPFSEVVDAVGAARVPGKNPLFSVMFQVQSAGYQLQNAEQLGLGMPDLAISQRWIAPTETKFDMSWHVIERDGKLLVATEYRTALFERSRIEQMLGHFHTLVDAVVENPSQKVSQFSLLSNLEKERILTDWSQGESVEKTTHCFPQRFEQQVEKTPNAIATCDYAQQGKTQTKVAQQRTVRSLTYQQLNCRANKLAHWLRSKGVESESLVGICLTPGIDLLTALLATLKVGAAYVPIDPTLPLERIRYMLADAKPAILIVRSDSLDLRLIEEDSVDVFYIDTEDHQLIAQPDLNLSTELTPENLAYVIYTSGSTGRPKGTQLTHGGLINYLDWCLAAYPIAEGCGAPVQSSVGFDATITSLFSPLLAGKQVVFGLGENEIESLQAALSMGFSFIKLTPAHLSALQPLLKTQQIQRHLLPKAFIIGGEALQSHHVDTWRKQYPEITLFNEYGPTEATVGCCIHRVTVQDSKNIPIGRPINGAQLYILDENKQIVPAGVPGELYIGGEGVAQGYLNQPGLTAERFVTLNLLGRLYKTGDLAAYQLNGTLQYLGRIDSQIKLRGFRIEPGEIEALLCQHEQIEQAVVVLRVEEDRRSLIAYVTTTAIPANKVSSNLVNILTEPLFNELRQQLSEFLPSYMLPSHIIRLESLPLTVNGKVDRAALPAPTVEESDVVQPRDRKERILLNIWQQILSREDVGIYDNFFEVGGDSISGMQIVSQAHEQGLQLTPAQLFEHQTIAEQAAIAKEKSADTFSTSLSTALPIGEVPLSPIQQDFFEKNLPNPHHYNQAVMVKVNSDIETPALQAALEQIVEHHDSLRLRFEAVKGVWQQQYETPEMISVPLDELDLTDQGEQALGEAIAALQASLHLTDGPLFRGALIVRSPHKYLLLIAHHLLVDGVSWRILLADLSVAYQQIVDKQPVAFPNKTTSFGYWTRHLKQQSFEAERAYWTKACCPVSPLPIDHSSGRNKVADEKEIVVCLNAEKTASLKTLRLPTNVVLLSALAQTFKQWSRDNVLVLDVEGHGRQAWDESLNLSRSVGWFTARYPLRLTLSAGTSDEQLDQIEQQIEQVPNGGVGYGALR